MIESTSQKLQTAGGAEREARELVEQLAADPETLWGVTAWLYPQTCVPAKLKLQEKLAAFAARCANEARLEALEQLGPLIKEWRGKRFDHQQLYCMCGSCQSERDCADALEDRIRALKAAPAARKN